LPDETFHDFDPDDLARSAIPAYRDRPENVDYKPAQTFIYLTDPNGQDFHVGTMPGHWSPPRDTVTALVNPWVGARGTQARISVRVTDVLFTSPTLTQVFTELHTG
jgi:hypothetical protein